MNINFSVNRNLGFENATEFKFSIDPNPLDEVKSIRWLFDDGYEAKSLSPIHRYLHEGTYNPKVFVYTETTVVSATTSVYVKPFLEESIYFDFVPPPAFAGHYSRYPFRLHITSKTTEDHFIDLGAMFSRSYRFAEEEHKWDFLKPQWRFVDLNGNVVEKLKTVDTKIAIDSDGNLDSTGTVVGVTGKAEFYFIEDIYNFDIALSGLPFTTIIATLQTDKVPSKTDYVKTNTTVDGFANSKATTYFPYVVEARVPDNLKISENGIELHKSPKWTDVKTPLIVSPQALIPFPDDWVDGNGISKVYRPLEYFDKTVPIFNTDVPVTIGVTNLSTTFVPSDTKFTLYEGNGYKVSGYYKGYFVTDTVSALGCVISAYSNATIPPMSGIYAYPILWVSNPESKTLHTVQYFFNTNLSAVSTVNLNKAHVYSFEIPVVDSSDYTNLFMATTGFHGVYSIAVTPFPDYHAWTSDSEKNKIYRYSTTGEMLCSIDLRTVVEENQLGYLVDRQVSPASIVLDGEKNLYVTLYDSISTLKFNRFGTFIKALTPISKTKYSLPPNISPLWYENNQYYYSDPTDDGDQNLLEPTGIDSDIDDNVWVTYSSYASGYLIKYDKNGDFLFSISYPVCSCPQEVVCDKNGYTWVIKSDIMWGDFGSIEKLNSNGVVVSSFGGVRQPNHATLDENQNLWFTFDYNRVGRINNRTSALTTITLSSVDFEKYNTSYWFDKSKNTDETVFEGISTDFRGNVYVLNTLENQIYVLDQKNMTRKDNIYINPQGFNRFIPKPLEPTYTEITFYGKSLQAQGDWSGFRWINKYGTKRLKDYTKTGSVFVSGSSVPLNYYKDNPYTLRKINDEFDLSSYMKSLAITPSLNESAALFDVFFKSIFDKEGTDSLGSKAYEKIANFVINHSDIETCNIDQLYDISDMLDYSYDNLRLNYPNNIKKLMDVFSVNESLLWGNLSEKVLSLPKLHIDQDPITSTSFMVTAGVPMVLKTRSLNSYRILQIGEMYGNNVYSIQLLASSIGLDPRDWRRDYDFYLAGDSWKNVKYENNVIDWNNPSVNIPSTLYAANSSWSSDQGIMEIMLAYYLLKGLDFLE